MARKKTKICLVCGKEFEGTAAAFTCSGACRTAMSRMLADGHKPEYWLIAKGKGQKMPLFFAKPSPIKKEKEVNENKVDYQEPNNNSYDSPIKKPLTLDEMAEISKKIQDIRMEKCPLSTHPKTFILTQESRISELEEKLTQSSSKQ